MYFEVMVAGEQFCTCFYLAYLLWNVFQLHQNDYDTGRALQALVKVINPKSIDKRWSDDDAVRLNLLFKHC